MMCVGACDCPGRGTRYGVDEFVVRKFWPGEKAKTMQSGKNLGIQCFPSNVTFILGVEVGDQSCMMSNTASILRVLTNCLHFLPASGKSQPFRRASGSKSERRPSGGDSFRERRSAITIA